MELISKNEEKVVIEFTINEFDQLCLIARAVLEDYNSVDKSILNLEFGEVKSFGMSTSEILNKVF